MVLAANFPDGSGYVLAAYLIFFLLLLIYLGVTAYRLLGLERRLTQVTEQLDKAESAGVAIPPAAPSTAAVVEDEEAVR